MPGIFPSLLTVSALTKQIRSTLEQTFPLLWVEGEVSNLRHPSSGHQYFTLKDQASQIRAVLFRSQVEQLKFALQDGLEVYVFGRLSVYPQRGEYQLLLEAVEPKGIGALQLAFLQLKAKLEEEGVFDTVKKKPLPLYPQHIGLVTSPFGAAIHDLLTIIHRRWPLARILIAPVAVQGDKAAAQLIEAIKTLNAMNHLDVLIVGRGGGSLEDLWTFNEERVVRAIASSHLPVISAVGHETDVTLADLAADFRAPTPSAAAEFSVPDYSTVMHHLEHSRIRLERSMRALVSARTVQVQRLAQKIPEPRLILGQFAQQVDELERQLHAKMKHWLRSVHVRLLHHQYSVWERNPLGGIHRQQMALVERNTRLVQGMSKNLSQKKHHLELWLFQLNQLNPLAVLARGYSILYRARDGKIVKKATDVSAGELVSAKLHEGELICLIQKTRPPW